MQRIRLVRVAILMALASAWLPLPSTAEAAPNRPLLGVEARVGGGMALGGGAGQSTLRPAPFLVGALVEIAVIEEPWTTAYASAFVEGSGRAGFGLAAGLRLKPVGGLRFSVGGSGVIAPYTVFGLTTGGGWCLGLKRMRVCGDLEGSAYFLGNDLPDDRIAAQLLFVLGVGFDAW